MDVFICSIVYIVSSVSLSCFDVLQGLTFAHYGNKTIEIILKDNHTCNHQEKYVQLNLSGNDTQVLVKNTLTDEPSVKFVTMAIRRMFSCQTIRQKSSTVFSFGPKMYMHLLINCQKIKS